MAKTAEPSKLCFVVGPIGADDSADRIHADWLLEMIIQPVMADFPVFETTRADQIAQPGMIDAQVINALLTADLVIADLSTLNPNAFYEIGIRHMAQKPIIHMQIADEGIPFDVSLYRAIKFSRERPRDLVAAQRLLKQQVQAILADGYQVENPVTKTRGVLHLEQHATPGQQVLLDQLQAIESRLAQVENRQTLPRTVNLATGSGKSGRYRLTGFPSSSPPYLQVTANRTISANDTAVILRALQRRFPDTKLIMEEDTSLLFGLPAEARSLAVDELKPPFEVLNDLEFRIIS